MSLRIYDADDSLFIVDPQTQKISKGDSELSDHEWAILRAIELEQQAAEQLIQESSLALQDAPAPMLPRQPQRKPITPVELEDDGTDAPDAPPVVAARVPKTHEEATTISPEQKYPRATRSGYFNGKWPEILADEDFPKFSPMPKLASRVLPDVAPEGEEGQVLLGVLPDDKVLADIKTRVAAVKGRGAPLSIQSVVEDFEVNHVGQPVGTLRRQGVGTEGAEMTDGYKRPDGVPSYRMSLKADDLGGGDAEVEAWTQYATPDRNMMHSGLLKQAVDDLAADMAAGKNVYVHCKSGKGRSATVVGGARVARLIDMAQAKGQKLSPKQVDDLIVEQFTDMHEARPVVGGYKQVESLRGLMYARAGLEAPATALDLPVEWGKPAMRSARG